MGTHHHGQRGAVRPGCAVGGVFKAEWLLSVYVPFVEGLLCLRLKDSNPEVAVLALAPVANKENSHD
jgi:hypothetical protein